jgi:hypothetical protein
MTLGFALASMRTNMTLSIVGRRNQRHASVGALRRKRSQGRGKRRSRGRRSFARAPPFPTPRPTAERVTGFSPLLRPQGCGKRRATLRRYGERASPAVSHTRLPPFPKTALRLRLRRRFPSSHQQGDTKCSKTDLTNQTPYEPGALDDGPLKAAGGCAKAHPRLSDRDTRSMGDADAAP